MAGLLPMAVAERPLPVARRLGIGPGTSVVVTLILVFFHFLLRLGMGMGAGAPDLLTIALLLNARRVRSGTAACIGFALGMLEDAFTLVAFGANTLAMTLVAILGVQTRAFFVSTAALSFQIVYFGAGKWLRDFVHWVLQQRVGLASGFLEPMILTGVPAALYAALVGVILVRLTGPFSENET